MTRTPQNAPSESHIAALDLQNLPDLIELWRIDQEGATLDHAQLESMQISAAHVVELHVLVDVGVPDYPVVFCRLPNLLGQVYLEGDAQWPLVFLDSSKAEDADALRATYLHEAAHLAADDQDHDFAFAVMHNLFRLKAGLPATTLDYDYRGCKGIELDSDAARRVSAAWAMRARESRLEHALVVALAKQAIAAHDNGMLEPAELECYLAKELDSFGSS